MFKWRWFCISLLLHSILIGLYLNSDYCCDSIVFLEIKSGTLSTSVREEKWYLNSSKTISFWILQTFAHQNIRNRKIPCCMSPLCSAPYGSVLKFQRIHENNYKCVKRNQGGYKIPSEFWKGENSWMDEGSQCKILKWNSILIRKDWRNPKLNYWELKTQ